MKDIIAYGEIRDGGFYPRNSAYYIQRMKDAGNVKDCLLTISGANRRTLDQNSYAWVVCDKIAYAMRERGYSEITKEMIYRRIEENYCGVRVRNENTDKEAEFIKPLKMQESDRFWEIIEEVRQNAMQSYEELYIETPAEHYGLKEEAYDLWKTGTITYLEAKKQSDKMQRIKDEFDAVET
jgi:hypothetical protein